MRVFFEYIREQRLPSDLLAIFDSAGIKFYEGQFPAFSHTRPDSIPNVEHIGCLIVQVHDHRTSPDAQKPCQPFIPRGTSSFSSSLSSNKVMTPSTSATGSSQSSSPGEVYRIVLGPSVETLYADLNQTWDLTDEQYIQIESRILALVQPSLCLDPSFEVSAIANHAYRTTTLSCPQAGSGDGVARGVKRRLESSVSEEEEKRLALRERLMRSMDETLDRPFVPTCVVSFHRCPRSCFQTAVLTCVFVADSHDLGLYSNGKSAINRQGRLPLVRHRTPLLNNPKRRQTRKTLNVHNILSPNRISLLPTRLQLRVRLQQQRNGSPGRQQVLEQDRLPTQLHLLRPPCPSSNRQQK